jgi:hypothetical protein
LPRGALSEGQAAMTDWTAGITPYLARVVPLLVLWQDTISNGAGTVGATLDRMAALQRHAEHLQAPPGLDTMHHLMITAMATLNAAVRRPPSELDVALETARVAAQDFEAALREAMRAMVSTSR